MIVKPFGELNDSVNLDLLDPKLVQEIPTTLLPLSALQIESLLKTHPFNEGKGVTPGHRETLQQLIKKIDETIKAEYPKGAFFKLSSRSPKDSWLGHREGFKCLDGKKVIHLLFDSERTHDDLWRFSDKEDNTLYIALRKWLEFDRWREFRGFVVDGELKAISQYDYFQYFPEIKEREEEIIKAIKEKVDSIRESLPQTVIADFIFFDNKVTFVECNPFDQGTDPCLFNWRKDDFAEFEFRYLKEESRPRNSLSPLEEVIVKQLKKKKLDCGIPSREGFLTHDGQEKS